MWSASKAWLSGATILAVVAVFGLASSPLVVLTLPVAFLVGLAFAAVGMIMTVLAKNWDFFSFYMTLIMTPMTMISGAAPTTCKASTGSSTTVMPSRR